MWCKPGTGDVINCDPATCAWDTVVLEMLFCDISEGGGGECSCSLWSDVGLELPLPLTSRSCSHVRSRSNCCCCCSFNTFSKDAACYIKKIGTVKVECVFALNVRCSSKVWKQLVHVINLIDFRRAERLQTAAFGLRK